jgi:hypothetical protein
MVQAMPGFALRKQPGAVVFSKKGEPACPPSDEDAKQPQAKPVLFKNTEVLQLRCFRL